MKRIKQYSIVFLIISIMCLLSGCGRKVKKYEIPLELLLDMDCSKLSQDDIKFYEMCRLKPWIDEGYCENISINSDNIVIIEFTEKQRQSAIQGMEEEVKNSDLTDIFQSLGVSVIYYEGDNEKVTYKVQSKSEFENGEYDNIIPNYIAVLLWLLIYNDVAYRDAKVTAEFYFMDTGESELIEYTCDNLY